MGREAESMAEIVAALAPMLKQRRFRKRRHSFNRAVGDGIVHVVNFWMAPKEPPSWTEVPGLRERAYGGFRIDFGVYVPEMTRTQPARTGWINEYNCDLRKTGPQLAGGTWWQLDDPGSVDVAEHILVGVGLPWLDRFADRAAVLSAFEQDGPLQIGMSPAGALDIADLYRAIGDFADERRVLAAYVEQPVSSGHAEVLKSYLTKHGHEDLVGIVRTRPG